MYRALVVPGKAGRCGSLANPGSFNTEQRDEFYQDEVTDTTLPGKASKLQCTQTVPKTDTGGQDENSQALERTRVKELGKMVP